MLLQTRRRFLTCLSLTSTGLVRAPKLLAGDGRPETTTVRLAKKIPVLCNAPQYIADDLLRAEGFSDVQYIVPGVGAALTAAVSSSTARWTGHGPNISAAC